MSSFRAYIKEIDEEALEVEIMHINNMLIVSKDDNEKLKLEKRLFELLKVNNKEYK